MGESYEPGKRTLAAIVFSDVASFSALMGQNEDRTLKLVQRDLALITGVCQKNLGRVLKSTGDGLLMYFDSAVQAVACALEAQQVLAEAAKQLPPEDVLLHRIGIHLGDVFLTETDVMGDGVNVAARLQGEAEPGGICFSQTVYDVVKNRLGVQATYLGPRELKNIKEAVPVYQILLAAQGADGAPVKPVGPGTAGRHWMVLGGIVAGSLAALVVITLLILYAVTNDGNRVAAGGTQPATQNNTSILYVTTTATGPAVAVEDPRLKAEIDGERVIRLRSYDFAGMLKFLEGKGLKADPLYDRYDKLVKLKRRIQLVDMPDTSKAKPIKFTKSGPGGDVEVDVWQNADGQIVVKDASGEQKFDFNDIEPRTMVAIAKAITKNIQAVGLPNRALVESPSILAEELRAAGLLHER